MDKHRTEKATRFSGYDFKVDAKKKMAGAIRPFP
jgi:hypothetical protein